MDILKSLDIALGVIVVYLTFALGVTAFNEAIAGFLSSRAKWLRKGIAALLQPAQPGGSHGPADSAVDTFYRSPYIEYLGQGSKSAGFVPRFAPSYIPPWTMLQGLLDTTGRVSADTFAAVDKIKTAAGAWPDDLPIKKIVLDLCERSENSIDKFRELLDKWFETFEAQVIAWYRQKTQWVLVGLSAFVVAALNLDTIALVRQFASDDKVLAAMVQKALDAGEKPDLRALVGNGPLKAAEKDLAAAQGTAKQKTEALDSATKAEQPDPAAIDAARAEVEKARKTVEEAAKKVEAERSKFEQSAVELHKGLTEAGIRLGWSDAERANLSGGYAWVLKLLGLVLSTFALSLGAPFWFDLLKSVASIRSVGMNIGERVAAKKAKGAG